MMFDEVVMVHPTRLSWVVVSWWLIGCGGQVVFEVDGSGGAGAASTSDGSAATSTNVGTSTASTLSTTGSFSSTTTGPSDPCSGLPCGVACLVCNDFECLEGACDTNGQCSPEASCEPELFCYVPRDEACVPIDQARFYLCGGCEPKGCAFFGDVIEGPLIEDGECCYLAFGECIPAP